jgi:hypothetical protein
MDKRTGKKKKAIKPPQPEAGIPGMPTLPQSQPATKRPPAKK